MIAVGIRPLYSVQGATAAGRATFSSVLAHFRCEVRVERSARELVGRKIGVVLAAIVEHLIDLLSIAEADDLKRRLDAVDRNGSS